jgi:Kef-type K+ transport system membrane component KefB
VACGLAVPPAVIIGMGLAFSSTAVALQVLQDRGETGARHGRATFSVLLFQDLTVRTHPLHQGAPHPLHPTPHPLHNLI